MVPEGSGNTTMASAEYGHVELIMWLRVPALAGSVTQEYFYIVDDVVVLHRVLVLTITQEKVLLSSLCNRSRLRKKKE